MLVLPTFIASRLRSTHSLDEKNSRNLTSFCKSGGKVLSSTGFGRANFGPSNVATNSRLERWISIGSCGPVNALGISGLLIRLIPYSGQRTPSWTDRIMYATYSDSADATDPSGITNLLYTSIPSYTTSDHVRRTRQLQPVYRKIDLYLETYRGSPTPSVPNRCTSARRHYSFAFPCP